MGVFISTFLYRHVIEISVSSRAEYKDVNPFPENAMYKFLCGMLQAKIK